MIHTFSLGDWRCHAIEAGTFALDGGALFGIVPRPVWLRRIQPDDRNRIRVAMRCLLIEHPSGPVLIDTGLGNKEDAAFRQANGVENQGPNGRSLLEAGLAEAGIDPSEVRWVINTHLHFDHAGGNTWEEIDENGVAVGGPRLTFPRAAHVVQWGELEFARHLNERTRIAYLPPNFEPVAEAGRWRLLRGDVDILPGISARVTPGHVLNHQSVVVKSGGETLVFLGDVMPTSFHLKLPWITAFDVEPLRTLESKRKLLRVAEDESWWMFFQHDPSVIMGRLGMGEGGAALSDVARVDERGFEGV
jgi:glyoxylase-like metal-dependent hydrolase (beta-lactamase superfamily II)